MNLSLISYILIGCGIILNIFSKLTTQKEEVKEEEKEEEQNGNN